MNRKIRTKVILEKDGLWSVVPCKMKDAMLETGDRNFKFKSELQARESISDNFLEMKHELMPIIFGDSYRTVFVHRSDLELLNL